VSAGTTNGSSSTPVGGSSLFGPPRSPVRMKSPALSVNRKKPATEFQGR
jgi:hypothetical protein